MKSTHANTKPKYYNINRHEKNGNYQKKTIISIEILRAIAACLVVYFHIGTTPTFGRFGVDIFFILSGFVISHVIENKTSAKDFLIHRVIRIIPLYWLMTFILFAIAAIKPDLLKTTEANIEYLIKSLFFIPHYRGDGGLYPILMVGWSLNYEILFYLVAFITISIHRKYYAITTCAGIAAIYFTANLMPPSGATREFFSESQILEFTLGILVYKLFINGWVRKIHSKLGVAIIFSSLSLMILEEANGFNNARFVLYGIPSAALVLSMLSFENTLSSINGRLHQGIIILGGASYSIYLSHSYTVNGIKKILGEDLQLLNSTLIGSATTFITSIIIGTLLYSTFDKPMHLWLKTKISKNINEKIEITKVQNT